MIARRRTRWRNRTRNQAVEPLRRYRPRTREEVAAIVREAERDGITVRAVGSGHSWSDVALTRGYLLDTHGLDRVLDLEADVLLPAARARRLVRVEAGIRLRELNAHLDSQGLAMAQLGGYDGQTVAGVISTSTHGSGLGLGPLPDAVAALEVVAAGGRTLRIEPSEGLSDPARHAARHPEVELVQDDAWFGAASVGMGCLGVIVAAVLEAVPAYWLTEVRRPSSWEAVREEIAALEPVRAHRHYEVYLNPHERRGRRRAVITTRDPAPEPRDLPRDAMRRHPLTEVLSSLPVTAGAINAALDLWPEISPWALDRALEGLADAQFTHKSFRVLNIGAANLLPAYSSEIAVPLDGRHVEAVERVIAIAERHRRLGSVFHTAPIALRFVRASTAPLSMMEGRDTMMIELIHLVDTEGGQELLAAYEEALLELGGRPHWGQLNWLTGPLVEAMYPRLGEWLAVHSELNASRVFDSPFSRRVGLARAVYAP